jgi:hypothetical protein
LISWHLTPRHRTARALLQQSPLALPDEAAFEGSRSLRLFAMHLSTQTMAAEYVYRLEPPGAFGEYPPPCGQQSEVKVRAGAVSCVAKNIMRTRTECCDETGAEVVWGGTDSKR